MRYSLFVLNILCYVSLTGQQEQFLQANNAYNESDHKRSINLYNEILSNGDESADLYLNLGNAYYESGELGMAILSYERGLKIDTDHEFLNQNLKYANKQVRSTISEIPDFFLSRYWRTIVMSFGSTGWAVVQILLFILIAIMLGVWLLSKELKTKKLAFYSLVLIVGLMLLSVIVGQQRYTSELNASHAIIVADTSPLLSGASTQSELLLELSEGVKVKLLDQIDDFLKVQLLDKEIGWVSLNDIETI